MLFMNANLGPQSSMCVSCSVVPYSATPLTAAHQAPLCMEFSRQEYWSGLPFPSPGDLSDPGIGPGSPALQADTLLCESPGKPSQSIESRILRHREVKETENVHLAHER